LDSAGIPAGAWKNQGWIFLDCLGFLRPKRDISMRYRPYPSRKEFFAPSALQKRKIADDAAAGMSGDRDPHGGIVTDILKFSKRFRPPEIKARSGGSVINLGSWRGIALGVNASGQW
jgi:hypothetical protein